MYNLSKFSYLLCKINVLKFVEASPRVFTTQKLVQVHALCHMVYSSNNLRVVHVVYQFFSCKYMFIVDYL